MRRGRPSYGIEQTFMRRRIVELNRSHATEVEQVSRALRVAGALWPGDLADEFVGLVVQVGVEVVAQKTIDKGCLEVFVVAQEGGGLRGEQEPIQEARSVTVHVGRGLTYGRTSSSRFNSSAHRAK